MRTLEGRANETYSLIVYEIIYSVFSLFHTNEWIKTNFDFGKAEINRHHQKCNLLQAIWQLIQNVSRG